MSTRDVEPPPELPTSETRIPCPLDGCNWVHVHVRRHVPDNFLAGVFGAGVVAAIQPGREQRWTEAALHEHFRSHKLEDFLATITRLRVAAGEQDPSRTVL